ncbi:MAG TPA: hypothetical protein VJJ98_03600, partial [Sedimentisphaerales bacterium]|nr:hypothetical protein [Sedimentisphaerales bacterium]
MYRMIYLLFLALLLIPAGAASAALPDMWASQDIGGPAIAGSADQTAGIWTVKGSGADIWGTSDQFHYCYMPTSGDVTISARVVSITNGTHEWTKAGVMIRETLNANSTHNYMAMTNNQAGATAHASSYQGRPSTGAESINNDLVPAGYTALPWYVQLKRVGNNFTGSVSPDGVVWTDVATRSTTMTASI